MGPVCRANRDHKPNLHTTSRGCPGVVGVGATCSVCPGLTVREPCCMWHPHPLSDGSNACHGVARAGTTCSMAPEQLEQVLHTAWSWPSHSGTTLNMVPSDCSRTVLHAVPAPIPVHSMANPARAPEQQVRDCAVHGSHKACSGHSRMRAGSDMEQMCIGVYVVCSVVPKQPEQVLHMAHEAIQHILSGACESFQDPQAVSGVRW